ncbi:MAG TPA: hypothetical protein VG165_10295 [Solirubrobacteraceae bacterium]|nr:hypothetical protein [Solirubrobacteraceae bacterium]
MSIDVNRVRPAELVALLGGLLLGVAMFLPWFEFSSGNLDAWSSFTVIDVLLALTAVAGVALFWLTLTRSSPALPVAAGVWTTLLGVISTLCIGLRLLDHPAATFDTCVGIWLGLAGSVLVLVGAWVGLNDERPSRRSPASPAR